MNFKTWYTEMAAPLEKHLAGVYYHGTSKAAQGESIFKSGIQPPDLTFKPKTHLTPVPGKVYITPELRYAVIYCLGGDMAGHNIPETWDKVGYLFEIPGSALHDIQPDEDSIGELLYSKSTPWLMDLAKRTVAPARLRGVFEGEYAYWASVGKQLLRRMTDWQKLDLIDRGAHIAHTGALIPTSAWKFDKSKTPLLHRDGSNFFELAEKIR